MVMAGPSNQPMIGGVVTTSLMLPLSRDLFDPPAESIVDNLLICTAVHESGIGPCRTRRDVRCESGMHGKLDIINFVSPGKLLCACDSA